MTNNQIMVNIFETTVDMCLDPYRYRTTAPLYAAMIPGSDSYLCFTHELQNLARELAEVVGTSKKVVVSNLEKAVTFKDFRLGDTDQSVTIRHNPLSPEKLDEFYSSALWKIGSLQQELRRCYSLLEEKKSAV